MSDATRDRIEGEIDEVTGQAKSAVGDLTGNERLKIEGDVDQAEGGLKEGIANVRDKVDNVVRDIKDR